MRAPLITRSKLPWPSRKGKQLSRQAVEDAMERKVLLYDKSGEEHFNLISALHKSVRSSDPDAALYWLARMLESGEDRIYIARRLVRMAIEDIGLADPRALEQTIAAQQAVHFLGIPEGDLALAQAAIYLAVAPKSDAAYKALDVARADVATSISRTRPLHLRNAPTRSDEGIRLWRRLPARPQVRRRAHGYGVPAALARRTPLLLSDESWPREADCGEAGGDTGGAEEEVERTYL